MDWLGVVSAFGGPLAGLLGVFAAHAFGYRKASADVKVAEAEARKRNAEADRIALQNTVSEATADLRSQVGSVAEAVALIKHEVLPNTGTSMNDAVRRLEDQATRAEGMLELAALDRRNLHEQIESESLRQRERELDARREHDDFREELRAMGRRLSVLESGVS